MLNILQQDISISFFLFKYLNFEFQFSFHFLKKSGAKIQVRNLCQVICGKVARRENPYKKI